MRSLLCAGALSLSLALAGHSAAANGRYPTAQFLVVGPGAGNQLLALQTTFGLVTSIDAGHTWHWVCEQGEGYAGMADPSLGLMRDGSLMISLPDGLSLAPAPYCNFARPATAPTQLVVDVANDPLGTRAVAGVTPLTGANSVWITDDLGQTWARGWSQTSIFIETIDIAPGHPSRMYISGYNSASLPTLFRSDDGGQTFAPTTTNVHGGYDAFIAGVDPSNPDVLYVRSDLSAGGTMLLRSSDAGVSFTIVATTAARMTGVALSPDGSHVWIAGRGGTDGVLRSDDQGLTFHRVAPPFTTLCLRFQNGVLYACADSATDGYALASSTDMGATFTPILRFNDVLGPDNCATGTPVNDRCSALWPAQRNGLQVDAGCQQDAACSDAGPPDTGTMVDASASDITAPADVGIDSTLPDAGATNRAGNCGCSVPSRSRTPQRIALLAILGLLVLRRRHR